MSDEVNKDEVKQEKQEKKKGGKVKNFFVGLAAIFVLILLISSLGDSDTETAPASYTKEQKQAFNSFYQEVLDKHAVADAAFNEAGATLTAVSESGMDRYTAYSKLSDNKKLIDGTRLILNEMKAPEWLSKDDKKTIDDAMRNLTTGLFAKSEGIDKILEFLDQPKPSLIEEAKTDFQVGNSSMMDGVAKFLQLGLIEDETNKTEN